MNLPNFTTFEPVKIELTELPTSDYIDFDDIQPNDFGKPFENLPIQDIDYIDMLRQHSTYGDSDWNSDVVQDAAKYLGVPYKWGGKSKGALDCSGFTYNVMKDLGYKSFPASSISLWDKAKREGLAFTDSDQLEPGDFVFFTGTVKGRSWGTPSHVGIYVGNGRFIGAQSKGVSYESLDNNYWKDKVIGYARFA